MKTFSVRRQDCCSLPTLSRVNPGAHDACHHLCLPLDAFVPMPIRDRAAPKEEVQGTCARDEDADIVRRTIDEDLIHMETALNMLGPPQQVASHHVPFTVYTSCWISFRARPTRTRSSLVFIDTVTQISFIEMPDPCNINGSSSTTSTSATKTFNQQIHHSSFSYQV